MKIKSNKLWALWIFLRWTIQSHWMFSKQHPVCGPIQGRCSHQRRINSKALVMTLCMHLDLSKQDCPWQMITICMEGNIYILTLSNFTWLKFFGIADKKYLFVTTNLVAHPHKTPKISSHWWKFICYYLIGCFSAQSPKYTERAVIGIIMMSIWLKLIVLQASIR